jgi:hypothetical protein
LLLALLLGVGCGGQVGSHELEQAPTPEPVATASAEADPIVNEAVDDSDRAVTGPHVGLVGGKRLYDEAEELFPTLRSSEITAITFAGVRVADDGALLLEGVPLFAGGRYVGDPAWPALVASLERAPTRVRRLELLLEPNGKATLAQLAPNLLALHQTLPRIDAIAFDDDALVATTQVVEVAGLIAPLGLKVSLLATPREPAAWGKLRGEIDALDPSLVERLMLDLEPSGTEQDVASFGTWFNGLALEPGWSSRHGERCAFGNAPEVVTKKAFFLRDSVQGAWVRLLDDSADCDAEYAPTAYARAIREAWTFQR